MAIMEISIGALKKLKIELLYDPAISLLCMYSKDSMSYHRDIHISMYIATVIILTRKYNLEVYHQIDNEIRFIYIVEFYSPVRKVNYEFCRKMVGSGKYNAKQCIPISERKTCIFFIICRS